MNLTMNLNPRVDVPKTVEGAKEAFNKAASQFPWLEIIHKGSGSHTGRGTSWAGSYDVYELRDPLSPEGFSSRLDEAANKIDCEVTRAVRGNRRKAVWW